ncbi:MAG: flavodoxin domain-containing protein [Candidatus Woesearchaeota archaeon]
MKTIIIYATKHGTTKKITDHIAKKLKTKKEEVEVVEIKKIKDYNLRVFDRVIIGASIHAGQIQTSIKKYCKENLNELKEKELGLFITCMIDHAEKQKEQLREAYPKELLDTSKAKGILGGEYLFEKMNFIEKLMVKIIAKTSKTTTKINHDAIDKFTDEMLK